MSMRLGKSNAWSVCDSTCDLSISHELVERTSEKTTYRVIVTVERLSKRMNRRVDDGELYVCLYEIAHSWRGKHREDNSNNPYCDCQNCVSGERPHKYLQQIVRGKNQYIFNVDLYQELSDTFYNYGNSYSRMVEYTKRRWGDDAEDGIYYIIGADLLHIRNTRNIIENHMHVTKKNPMLEKSAYDFRWYSNTCDTHPSFVNMLSFASNITCTDTITLYL